MLSLSKHTRVALLCGFLVACGEGAKDGGTTQHVEGRLGDPIRCALGGAKTFAPDCTREVTRGPGGEIWIIRDPAGGFRRFVLIDKGTRIATADGADEVQASRVGADLEVRVAGNRYLFPAAPEPKPVSTNAR